MIDFKVGDVVKSNQLAHSYVGTIKEISLNKIYVSRPGYSRWECQIVGDKVATANGCWDGKSWLENLSSLSIGKRVWNDSTKKEMILEKKGDEWCVRYSDESQLYKITHSQDNVYRIVDYGERIIINYIKKPMKRMFRLLKDTASINKGAIYQEQCEDGSQPFQMISDKELFYKFPRDRRESIYEYRKEVEENPEWFAEVFATYMTADEKAEYDLYLSRRVALNRIREDKDKNNSAKKKGRPRKIA